MSTQNTEAPQALCFYTEGQSSPKATCTRLGDAHFFFTVFLLSKLYGKWQGEAGTKKRGLVSISILISLPVGCARVWMLSALYVITPTNWSLLCSSGSLGRRWKLLGGRLTLIDPLIRSRDTQGTGLCPKVFPCVIPTISFPSLTLFWLCCDLEHKYFKKKKKNPHILCGQPVLLLKGSAAFGRWGPLKKS